MKKKILILGGGGFIGQHLIKKLSKKDYNLTSISFSKKKFKKYKNIKYIFTDISKPNKFKKKLEKDFQVVINFSGNIDHKNYVQTKKVHYEGLKNLVHHINKKEIELFIHAGSSLEYGNLKSPQSEKNNCTPLSGYGKSKYYGSKYLLKKLKKKSVILRLYQVYGPNQKYDRLVPFTIKSCLSGKKFACSDGYQLRDFLFVDDLIDLIIKILNSKKIKPGVYNVGYGKPKKVRDIISMIHSIIKRGKPDFGKIKMRKDEIPVLYPDIKKVVKTYRWKPKIDIFTGLKKTINSYKKNMGM